MWRRCWSCRLRIQVAESPQKTSRSSSSASVSFGMRKVSRWIRKELALDLSFAKRSSRRMEESLKSTRMGSTKEQPSSSAWKWKPFLKTRSKSERCKTMTVASTTRFKSLIGIPKLAKVVVQFTKMMLVRVILKLEAFSQKLIGATQIKSPLNIRTLKCRFRVKI